MSKKPHPVCMAGLHDPSDLDTAEVLGLWLCSLAGQS